MRAVANAAASGGCELFYWREQSREVDFVLRAGRTVVALEVKSGREPDAFPGLAAFAEALKPMRTLLVGGDSELLLVWRVADGAGGAERRDQIVEKRCGSRSPSPVRADAAE